MSNTYSAIISSKWYCFNQRVVSDVIDYNHSVINLTTASVNITNTIKICGSRSIHRWSFHH